MNENQGLNLKQELIRHQMALRAILVFVATVILLVAGLLPLFRSAGATLKKISTREQEATELARKVSLLSQIDQNVLKQRAQIIKTALPENKDVVAYLLAVDGLSKELGLSFGGITLAPGVVSSSQPETKTSSKGKANQSKRSAATLSVLDTEVKIIGSRDGIYSFLRQVEKTLPLMQISDVTVTASGADTFSMSLSLGMLWAPTPAQDLKGAVSLFNEKEEAYFQKLATFKAYSSEQVTAPNLGTGKINLFEQD